MNGVGRSVIPGMKHEQKLDERNGINVPTSLQLAQRPWIRFGLVLRVREESEKRNEH
jgi:hypothetical protein